MPRNRQSRPRTASEHLQLVEDDKRRFSEIADNARYQMRVYESAPRVVRDEAKDDTKALLIWWQNGGFRAVKATVT